MRAAPLLLVFGVLFASACDTERVEPLRPDAARPEADGFHDPLSTPAAPTLDPADFTSSTECGTCHETHLAEWRTSMHAYAMIDPVFRALVAVRQVDFGGEQDQFCTQCHSAIATRGGEIVPGFQFDDLSPIALEGVTCDACHRVSELVRPNNSGHLLDPSGPVRGSIRDPQTSDAHAAAHSPLHSTSEFCGGCHDIFETGGLPLERPYREWTTSPAAAEARNCQSCHMPTYRGRATDDAPERDLHRHRFVGVDVPLTDGFATPEEVDAIRADARALLEGAAELELTSASTVVAGQQLDLVITVRNLIDGHNLPTGSTFIRQMWLEVIVRDAMGGVLYETGTLDGNGDLRNFFSQLDQWGDDDLITFGSGFVDELGRPEIFSWRAVEHFSFSLPPLFARTFTLFVPTATDTPGPLEVSTRLRFRSHPPFLLRALDLDGLVDRIEIYDLESATTTVDVTVP